MLTYTFVLLSLTLSCLPSTLAHPHIARRDAPASSIFDKVVKKSAHDAPFGPDSTGDLKKLYEGNLRFKEEIKKSGNPDLLKDLKEKGQKPAFTFIGCSDSRASVGTIFDNKPGEIFSQRNIANQFISTDVNSVSVLAYGVGHLRVRHVIVLGHYGCGGVGAAIASPPSSVIDAGDGALYSWIEPIRQIYLTSTRKEIVELRNKNANKTEVKAPEFNDPGFKALIEENVKHSVKAISESPTMRNHYRKLNGLQKRDENAKQEVWIHGWVYDIETGNVKDLKVTVSPKGPSSMKPPPKPSNNTSPIKLKPTLPKNPFQDLFGDDDDDEDEFAEEIDGGLNLPGSEKEFGFFDDEDAEDIPDEGKKVPLKPTIRTKIGDKLVKEGKVPVGEKEFEDDDDE